MDIKARVRIGPFDFGYGAGEFNLLFAIELCREGMMRIRRNAAEQACRCRDGYCQERSHCVLLKKS
jgi:hypothetical protein